jgi:hypothetical protein
VAAISALLLSALVAPGHAGAHPYYWGASISQVNGTAEQAPWTMNAVSDFTGVTGKNLSLITWGSPWYSQQFCNGYCSFQTANFDKVRSYGAVPMFSWSPVLPTSVVRPDHAIATNSQGTDAYIRQWAKDARAWGHPLFLRFAWEMNGRWFPWGLGSNGYGNTPADYVAMWRHVHTIFNNVGAVNVTWVWCPNWTVSGFTYQPLSNLYPGSAWVAWTCIDGYNADNPWLSLRQLYSSTYQTIVQKIAPNKPMLLGEVSSTEQGGSKASWINNMFHALPLYFPKVYGFLWYEGTSIGPSNLHDWPVESSQSSQSAFRAGISDSRYRTNIFGGLSSPSGKVPLPF